MPDSFVVHAEDLELPAPDVMDVVAGVQAQAYDDAMHREIERLIGRNFWWRNGAEHYWPREEC